MKDIVFIMKIIDISQIIFGHNVYRLIHKYMFKNEL